ncbi:related to 2-dehydropantoate 2-reductase [Ramularia collo-cygni]|uniref:2-dehydropantoate 2-reductase n=1 Tax=Ramularia collo-cygni TaxID=112498 RepID=A0A2D3VF15_9PEZI|nr:related to 2-dehydropantoate 2-reductase [Ramularia collo-cygni]CZT25835.1 related to 2-dehydropantoate 2-reductase [Ramularia collo-cygni]
MPPKILLHGSGAVGTIYLYLLLKAGCDVTAVCRSNYEAAKADGFHIDSDIYGKGIHIHPNIVRDPEEAAAAGQYDYLIVACKALPDAKIAETVSAAVTPGHTTIVLIQNGIDIEQEYASHFPENPLLSCVVYLPTTQIKPGYIEMGDLETLEMGPYPASAHNDEKVKASADQLITLLKSAGGNAHYFQDIQEKRWNKLLLNASWNPICALTLSRDAAFLLSSPESEGVIVEVMNEVIAISKALGYSSVNEAAGQVGLNRAKDRIGTKGIEPSMLVDVLWNRRMEVEVILGNPLRKARQLGVQVPRIEMLYILAKVLDDSIRFRQQGESLDGEKMLALFSSSDPR